MNKYDSYKYDCDPKQQATKGNVKFCVIRKCTFVAEVYGNDGILEIVSTEFRIVATSRAQEEGMDTE